MQMPVPSTKILEILKCYLKKEIVITLSGWWAEALVHVERVVGVIEGGLLARELQLPLHRRLEIRFLINYSRHVSRAINSSKKCLIRFASKIHSGSVVLSRDSIRKFLIREPSG